LTVPVVSISSLTAGSLPENHTMTFETHTGRTNYKTIQERIIQRRATLPALHTIFTLVSSDLSAHNTAYSCTYSCNTCLDIGLEMVFLEWLLSRKAPTHCSSSYPSRFTKMILPNVSKKRRISSRNTSPGGCSGREGIGTFESPWYRNSLYVRLELCTA